MMKSLKQHTWKIIGLIAIVSIGASIVYSNKVAEEANEGIVFEAHIKGAENPKAVLTEYSDFQCPACGQFYPVIQELLATYPDDLALEYKHFPLVSIHPHAVPAAKAAEAAGQQGKFFEMHDKLFEEQGTWSKSGSPVTYFEEYAEVLELDIALFKRHMKASKIQDKVQSEFAEAQSLGLTGTPSLFLNGQRMQFASVEDFANQIAAAVGAASSSEAVAPAPAEPEVRFGL